MMTTHLISRLASIRRFYVATPGNCEITIAREDQRRAGDEAERDRLVLKDDRGDRRRHRFERQDDRGLGRRDARLSPHQRHERQRRRHDRGEEDHAR